MTSLAAIHVARKQLGIEDDDYRDLAERITGKRSSADMSEAERVRLLEELRRRGFKRSSNTSRTRLEGPFAPKFQALWIAAWNLGVVRDRTDDALIAFVKRQTGIDHPRFVQYADDAAKAIEALKGWLAREADVDWNKRANDQLYRQTSGFRIAWAQWKKLGRGDGLMFRREVMLLTGKSVDSLIRERDWQPVMNAFGERIRSKDDG